MRKITEDLADKCVFLMGSRSGRYYCGIYEARPHDCGDFTPIGCDDVDEDLPRKTEWKIGVAIRSEKTRQERTTALVASFRAKMVRLLLRTTVKNPMVRAIDRPNLTRAYRRIIGGGEILFVASAARRHARSG